MNSSIQQKCGGGWRNQPRGLSLVEVLVSMGILVVMMLLFTSMISTTSSTWSRGEARMQNFQSGRAVLELMERELKPAVATPRVQFALTKGEILTDVGPDQNFVPSVASGSHAAFFSSPIGESGDLVLLGYYLERDDDKGHFWLRRLYVRQSKLDASGNSPFPIVTKSGARASDIYESTADPVGEIRPHHQYANWFFTNLEPKHFDDLSVSANLEDICVSTVANGVIALWLQAFDQQGNPIPSLVDEPGHHPAPAQPILYNSASYLVQANTTVFDDGSTSIYTGRNPSRTSGKTLAFRASTVPTTIQVTIVLLDSTTLSRIDSASIPVQPTLYRAGVNGNELDVDASIAQLTDELLTLNIRDYRVFSKRIKLLNGGK